MIVSLATITITHELVELPDTCPATYETKQGEVVCGADLTEDITQHGMVPCTWYGPWDAPYDSETGDGDSPTEAYTCPSCSADVVPLRTVTQEEADALEAAVNAEA